MPVAALRREVAVIPKSMPGAREHPHRGMACLGAKRSPLPPGRRFGLPQVQEDLIPCTLSMHDGLFSM